MQGAVLVARFVGAHTLHAAASYVDPSVVTYAIQAFAAVAVALSAVAGVALRRTRKAIFRVLGIEEKHGPTEPRVQRIDPSQRAEADQKAAEALERQRLEMEDEKPLGWPARLLRAGVACGFMVFTLFVVAPFELVASNSSDLVLGLDSLWPPLLLAAVALAIFLSLAVSMLRDKKFNCALGIVVGVGIAAYLQAMFMNVGLPAADGRPVPWYDRDKISLLSAVVWFVVVVGLTVLMFRRPKYARPAVLALSVMLSLVQLAGVASLWFDGSATNTRQSSSAGKIVVTEQGMLTVAPTDNVIVIVLDTMDTATLLEVLDEEPATLDEFTGFTLFQDSAGSMIPTRFGIPTLLAGYAIEYGQGTDDYFSQLYDRSVLLDKLYEENYSIGVYSSQAVPNQHYKEYLMERSINVKMLSEEATARVDWLGTIGIMWKCALYRDLPWVLKPYFWFYTDDINQAIVPQDLADTNSLYTFNDALFARKLRSKGLSVDDSQNKAFRFIHLVGAHSPYTLDRNGESATRSTLLEQSIGSFSIVNDYLADLKRLGVYDEATIIVTADHGYWEYNVDAISKASSPIILVKPSQTAEEACVPLAVSWLPASQWDVTPTIYDAIGGDVEDFDWTGECVWQLDDADRIRYFLMTEHNSFEKKDYSFKEYVVDGYALDFDNWERTGREWPFEHGITTL